MIKITNLRKSFKDNDVLKDISFEVDEGEVVAIIGPSGSGKSTLLRCLNFLETAESGEIEIDDITIDVSNTKRSAINELRMQTSMVFQHYNLFKNKTALENVSHALVVAKKMRKEDAEQMGRDLLEQDGKVDKMKQDEISLSCGQHDRIRIDRVVVVSH